jgi:hypothetical protein
MIGSVADRERAAISLRPWNLLAQAAVLAASTSQLGRRAARSARHALVKRNNRKSNRCARRAPVGAPTPMDKEPARTERENPPVTMERVGSSRGACGFDPQLGRRGGAGGEVGAARAGETQ